MEILIRNVSALYSLYHIICRWIYWWNHKYVIISMIARVEELNVIVYYLLSAKTGYFML